jgi:hypothetical protein
MTEPQPSTERPPLPDRLCTETTSRFYDGKVLAHDVGIRFNGRERTDVIEYCASEGWIKVSVGNKVDRKGNPLLIKLKGTVEVFYR